VFHTKEYGQGKETYNNGVCVKRSTSNKFEVDYYRKLEKVIELQYHRLHNRVFLSKCYWYDTTNREIIVEPLSWFGRNLFKGNSGLNNAVAINARIFTSIISSFFEQCSSNKCENIYFHNLIVLFFFTSQ
jgi:hypothetical protein